MLTAIRTRLREHGDDGFSLMEMVVSMTIASIIGAMALTWFIGASDASTATRNSSFSTAAARTVLQSWSRYLQFAGSPTTQGSGAGRIRSLTASSIDFYAYLNNSACTTGSACPTPVATEIVLSVANGKLVQRVGSGGASTIDTAGGTVTVGTSTGTGCLFAVTVNGVATCTNLTQAQLDATTSVTMAFTVTPRTGHGRSYTTSATFTTYSNVNGGANNAPLS